MKDLFRLPRAAPRDPEIEAWFAADDAMRRLVQPWFEELRGCGADLRECLHDGYPTACAGDAAFAYVGAFRAHANLGFFHGVDLDDPAGLLQGSGKRMRHVKLQAGRLPEAAALRDLIAAAYRDIRLRLTP